MTWAPSPRAAVADRRALRVLISSGPTREPLDPVRYLSNYSTGFMGACLAQEALRRGHQVTVVSGPASVPLPPEARVIAVERAEQMRRALRQYAASADVVVMAAAVADFRPVAIRRRKISRSGVLTVKLTATPDILATLPRRAGQLVVGFALETSQAQQRAADKLARKQLDLIVAQHVRGGGGPFGRRPVDAALIEAGGAVTRLGEVDKPRLARALLDKIEALWYGGTLAGTSPLRSTAARRKTP